VQAEEQKKYQEQEYVVPGQSSGSSANIKGRLKGNVYMQSPYSECLGKCE